MDFEKFSERSRGFIQSSQGLAIRRGHQRWAPEHLLKVLFDDKEGLVASLVTGAGQLHLSPEMARVLEQAQQLAEKAGDSYVTVERLALALVLAEGTPAARILKDAGVTAQGLNRAIEQL